MNLDPASFQTIILKLFLDTTPSASDFEKVNTMELLAIPWTKKEKWSLKSIQKLWWVLFTCPLYTVKPWTSDLAASLGRTQDFPSHTIPCLCFVGFQSPSIPRNKILENERLSVPVTALVHSLWILSIQMLLCPLPGQHWKGTMPRPRSLRGLRDNLLLFLAFRCSFHGEIRQIYKSICFLCLKQTYSTTGRNASIRGITLHGHKQELAVVHTKP